MVREGEVNCLQAVMPWAVNRELATKVEETTDPRYGFRPEDRPIQLRIKYGIVNVDKPPGPSSHEVVAWIKRMMKLSHAGHGGTLETS
jgi:H/ACA ribonucleoprotein complex subunit 4